ncbi:acetoacetate decarboxylase family protein [Amycolatopsis panacis]|uniref:acetoacetate decarboxylase family protein n=1 Tax=Amycolatopsis panacis TaxID=2340917 RepID=UPI0013142709|nr:acetoacetate decarboxylase family protein [Amycolatopsis panacis]
MSDYPPEPWRLAGEACLSMWRLPVDEVAGLPAGAEPILIAGRASVFTAWIDYRPPGQLSYRELLCAVAVHGRGLAASITQIWVDSEISRDGGRELWGIPKELASFGFTGGRTFTATTGITASTDTATTGTAAAEGTTADTTATTISDTTAATDTATTDTTAAETAAVHTATTHAEPTGVWIATAAFTPRAGLPFPLPARFEIAQTLAGRLTRTPVRWRARPSLAAADWAVNPAGPLGQLAGKRPVGSAVLRGFTLEFGPRGASTSRSE